MRHLIRIFIGILAAFLLASCSSQPPRDAQTMASDRLIEQTVRQRLKAHPGIYERHIEVNAYNGVVTLSGLVFDGTDMGDAVRIASEVPGVKSVANDMEIPDMGPDRPRRR
ncbi:MAG: BON domain-containing protein [Betaproteobacteria bacterium]|nr:BON domain-containing protein [Betaproteobacteria bacterium]MDE2622517.1 BON domain-containing protein [Betaproteobacteria bacterium]